jgi:hypothetical protein
MKKKLADIEAVDHAVRENRVNLHLGQIIPPFGELRLQGVIELNCDRIRGVAQVAALGLSVVRARPSGYIHVCRRRSCVRHTELRWKGPMAVGSRNESAKAKGDGRGWLDGI